ncbi:uncharacterized protein EDB93DRAFT_1109272 [Suillus bovinus]|uniref:uncharacterized protein n=1 Tax=Suillus bovinus TaxID=48563 RepID=UPI001B871929|nr:uncharacterized protein EDB93DRAFT_1109272 [Suillus bovinus]KAG2127538.1 hypothetical protein EDB93DRAFT_1109272 [Suillus bovinus]
MSFDQDIDGYDADTSISFSDSRSSTPKMTPSDDMFVNPAYWHAHSEKEHLIRQQLLHHPNTMPPWPDEPESDPPEPTLQQVISPPHVDNPESITEPESDPPEPTPQQVIIPSCVNNPESVTEPESDPPEPMAHSSTITKPVLSMPKSNMKSIFTIPSPPPPESIYWKYVSKEEDEAWYNQLRTDKNFLVVHAMKQELEEAL